MLPLNETTISSLDLTVITPLTPRREKNKDKNDNNRRNNNKSNNYKNESRHCQPRQLHCRGYGDCVNACDGSGDEHLQKLSRKAEEQPRPTMSAATSPIRFDCGFSAFNDSLKLGGGRGDSGRKPDDYRFKKKEKISDFVDFIELLSEYFLWFFFLRYTGRFCLMWGFLWLIFIG